MPNGTPLSVWVAADVPVSGGLYTVVWQYAGTVLLNSGSASLSIDTTHGNPVPLFHAVGIVWVINAPPPGRNTPPPTAGEVESTGGYLLSGCQLSSNANSP